MSGSSFAYDGSSPTLGTRRAIRSLTRSLTGVRSVRCEGYADFGGAPGGERPLSLDRARAVCAVLARNTSGVSTVSVGYGIFRPVVIGGHHGSRGENRRVVVKVTRSGPVTRVPDAPHLSRVVAARTSASVRFERPATDGGAAILRYQVSLDGGRSWRNVSTTGGGPFRVVVAGLTPGTRYSVAVRAANRLGTGARSNTVATRTLAAATVPGPVVTVPDPPHLSTVVPTQTSVTIGFERPADDGGAAITQYQGSVDDGVTWRDISGAGPGPFSSVIDGLTPATSYTIAVRAVNGSGTSAPSNKISTSTDDTPPVPVVTVPDPPSLTSALAARNSIDIQFQRPDDDGGAAVNQYQASVDGGAIWNDVAGTGPGPFSASLTGLTPGTTYTIVLRAINTAGASVPSNSLVRTTTSGCGPTGVTAGSGSRGCR
jgi:titin